MCVICVRGLLDHRQLRGGGRGGENRPMGPSYVQRHSNDFIDCPSHLRFATVS